MSIECHWTRDRCGKRETRSDNRFPRNWSVDPYRNRLDLCSVCAATPPDVSFARSLVMWHWRNPRAAPVIMKMVFELAGITILAMYMGKYVSRLHARNAELERATAHAARRGAEND